MTTAESSLRMSLEEFRLLRDLIRGRFGIHFEDGMRYLLEHRLQRRCEERLCRSFREYEQFLRYDPSAPEELDAVVEILTTNETYFFRESYQLETFTEEVLPEILKRKRAEGKKSLRIWSAGCSSGEEPYTLAMLLAREPSLHGWEWEVFATDISRRALTQARSARYRRHAFRAGVPEWANRFLPLSGNGERTVSEDIRRRVTFAAINLMDADRLSLVRRLDAIFCRNVLIYFDEASRRKTVELFWEKLQPGGFLFLGHSESLINLSTRFQLRHFAKDMIYQRPIATDSGEGT